MFTEYVGAMLDGGGVCEYVTRLAENGGGKLGGNWLEGELFWLGCINGLKTGREYGWF